MKLLLYCTKAKPYLVRNDLPNGKREFAEKLVAITDETKN